MVVSDDGWLRLPPPPPPRCIYGIASGGGVFAGHNISIAPWSSLLGECEQSVPNSPHY